MITVNTKVTTPFEVQHHQKVFPNKPSCIFLYIFGAYSICGVQSDNMSTTEHHRFFRHHWIPKGICSISGVQWCLYI